MMLTSILKQTRKATDRVEDDLPSKMAQFSVSFSETVNIRRTPRWATRCGKRTRRLWKSCLHCRQEIQTELNLYKAIEMDHPESKFNTGFQYIPNGLPGWWGTYLFAQWEIHPESKFNTGFYRHLLPKKMKMNARQAWREAFSKHMKFGIIKCSVHQTMQNKSVTKTPIWPPVLKRLHHKTKKFKTLVQKKVQQTRICRRRKSRKASLLKERKKS